MGNTSALELSKLELPSLEVFNQVKLEYDSLKKCGLSNDEIRPIIYELIHKLKTEHEQNANNPLFVKCDLIKTNTDIITFDDRNSFSKFSMFTQADSSSALDGSEYFEVDSTISETTESFILVIDDSPECCKEIHDVLSLFYSNILFAKSAKNGFDLIQLYNTQIKLIFLDVIMPKVDGLECLSWIKSSSEVSDIPVYMMSGRMSEDLTLKQICVEHGAVDIISKPIDYDKMRDILMKHNILKGGADDDNDNDTVDSPKIFAPVLPLNYYLPAFKLCDSELQEFIIPDSICDFMTLNCDAANNTSSASDGVSLSVLFVCLPTLFHSDFHTEKGIITTLRNQHEMLKYQHNFYIVCISSDLPSALAAAKMKYNIPFAILSDPTLSVCSHLVGITKYNKFIQPHSDRDNAEQNNINQNHHPYNSYNVSSFGLVHMSGDRRILRRWVMPTFTTETTHPTQPVQDSDGIHRHPALAPVFTFPQNLAVWVSGTKQSVLPKLIKPKRPKPVTLTVETQNTTEGDSNSIILTVPTPELTPRAPSRDHKSSSSSSSGFRASKMINNNVESTGLESFHDSGVDSFKRQQQQQHQQQQQRQQQQQHSLSILFLQDNSVSAKVAIRQLELRGHTVTAVSNGQRAYDILISKAKAAIALGSAELPFSLIIIDVIMPVCDGIELLTLLKEHSSDGFSDGDQVGEEGVIVTEAPRLLQLEPPKRNAYGNYIPAPRPPPVKNTLQRQLKFLSRIPVIVLSGLQGTELSEQCLEIGATAVMKKPFNPDEFQAILETL